MIRDLVGAGLLFGAGAAGGWWFAAPAAPVIPAGNGPAGSGAKGFSGVGDGDGVWAIVLIPKHEHKIMTANSKWCTRFIVSPLKVFRPASFA